MVHVYIMKLSTIPDKFIWGGGHLFIDLTISVPILGHLSMSLSGYYVRTYCYRLASVFRRALTSSSQELPGQS